MSRVAGMHRLVVARSLVTLAMLAAMCVFAGGCGDRTQKLLGQVRDAESDFARFKAVLRLLEHYESTGVLHEVNATNVEAKLGVQLTPVNRLDEGLVVPFPDDSLIEAGKGGSSPRISAKSKTPTAALLVPGATPGSLVGALRFGEYGKMIALKFNKADGHLLRWAEIEYRSTSPEDRLRHYREAVKAKKPAGV